MQRQTPTPALSSRSPHRPSVRPDQPSQALPSNRHRANDSARAFDSLARLAEKHRCCILLVRHLRKRGRGLTSIELSAAVRTEFIAGSSPDVPTRPALVQVKSNFGPCRQTNHLLMQRSPK
jgi:hypothetical protein